jgi:DNA (cytosine-5)-methyltransferase 1
MSWSAADICSGAGGLTRGLDAAGFETVFAIDNDADACATYRASFPGVDLAERDINGFDFMQLRGVDLIAGGPPCQPFSIGGRRLGKVDDRDLLREFVRAVVDARPRAFILENVPGLASLAHRDYLAETLAPLAGTFAIFGPHVDNAADYGIPQTRRRLIVVGVSEGCFLFPAPLLKAARAAGEMLTKSPLGEPNPSKVVFAKRPEPRPNPYHGHLFNGGGRPVDPDAPAPTILASAGGNKTPFLDCNGLVPPYHRHLMRGGEPRKGELPGARRLTVAECALLQTFPKGMVFAGARSSQYQQVGNALPPQLAAVLGDAILSALSKASRRARAPVAA